MHRQKILFSIIASVLLGFSSGLFTVTEINTWYVHLAKPSWNPPNWLFAPVWTTLYILIGISFGLIWSSANPAKAKAMSIFIVQFVLNLLWSFLFFKLHDIGFAMLEVWVLFILILLTVIFAARINRVAALLLLPYLFWVLFASTLNSTIWLLNK
ncbi:MAG: tryptophan-rich sensory protein [Bacteroidetes bacterium]|nr:tryptophan-rich sensory protein [Bacteroidota bacterium]